MNSSIIRITIFLLVYTRNCAGLESPCPHILRYETPAGNGKWQGALVLRDQDGLQGVSLGITLDSKADTLINNFGEITTLNNRNFVINSLDYNLQAGQVLRVEFTVKYNQEESPPNIISIRLNGVEICANGFIGNGSDTDSPQYLTTAKIETTTISQYDPMCGTKPQDQSFLYDVEKSEEYWPWHTAIMMIGNPRIEYHGGGTLITEKFVLTAAQCVTVIGKSKILDKDMLMLYLGIIHLSAPGSYYELRSLKDIKIHDEYDPIRYYNDLALIELARPVQYHNHLRPACLWNGDLEIDSLIGQHGIVVGYAKDENNNTVSDLMKASLLIVDLETCLDHDRNFFSQHASPKDYCAGSDEKDTFCGGYSGGGMVVSKPSAPGNEMMWYIRGLVSTPRDRGNVCNTESYAVFTDVAQYVNWIQETINVNNV